MGENDNTIPDGLSIDNDNAIVQSLCQIYITQNKTYFQNCLNIINQLFQERFPSLYQYLLPRILGDVITKGDDDLLDRFRSLNLRDVNIEMWIAVMNQEADHLKQLIARKADLTEKDSKGRTPIWLATEKKAWHVVQAIAESHTASSDGNEKYGYALIYAAKANAREACAALLQARASDNYILKGSEYYTLHYFVWYNNPDLIGAYLQARLTDVNWQRNESFPTPLILAAREPQVTLNTLDALLRLKGLEFHKRQNGKTALQIALDTSQYEKAVWMIYFMPTLCIEDFIGFDATKLHFQYDLLPEKIQVLLECGANLTQFNRNNLLSAGSLKLINTVQLQQAMDLSLPGDYLDLQSVLIETRAQLNYVLRYKNNLCGCTLSGAVDLNDLPLAALGIPTSDLTLRQFSHYLSADIPQCFHKVLNPWPALGEFDLFDANKRIKDLTNAEFENFISWCRAFTLYFIKNKKPVPEGLMMIRQSTDRVFSGVITLEIIRELIEKYQKLCNWKTNLYGAFFGEKALISPFEVFLSSTLEWHEAMLDTIYHIVIQNRKEAFSFPTNHPVFRFYFCLSVLLVRMNYPKKLLFPESSPLDKISAYLFSVKEIDVDHLIFVGDAWPKVKVYVVEEIIERLRLSENFCDPITLRLLNNQAIEACLKNISIRQAVSQLHQQKLQKLNRVKLPILDEIAEQMKTLGEILYQASTDCPGRETFDEEKTEAALDFFSQYIDSLGQTIINALNQCRYYLKDRRVMTNFSELFSQAQHNSCSGYLGRAISEWADGFEKEKTQIARAHAHYETPFSKYLVIMEEIPPEPVMELPQEYKVGSHYWATKCFAQEKVSEYKEEKCSAFDLRVCCPS